MSGLLQLKQLTYAEIEDRYKCSHPSREIRKRTIANGHTSFVSQCIECGQTSLPIGKKAALAQCPSPPPYDDHIQQRRRAQKHAEYVRAYLTLRPVLAAEYQAYLASDDWKERRDEAMSRANGQCEICTAPASDIHHLSYQNIGAELPSDLMAVCRVCHLAIHKNIGG